MNLTISTTPFREALEIAGATVSGKLKESGNSCVLMHAVAPEAPGDDSTEWLHILSGDGSSHTKVSVPGFYIRVREAGTVCLPHADLMAYVSKAPETTIDITVKYNHDEHGRISGNVATLKSGSSRVILPGPSPTSFYAPPIFEGDGDVFGMMEYALDSEMLEAGLKHAAASIDPDECSQLNGVEFGFEPGEAAPALKLFSFDRCRGSVARCGSAAPAHEYVDQIQPFSVHKPACEALRRAISLMLEAPEEMPQADRTYFGYTAENLQRNGVVFHIPGRFDITIKPALLSAKFPRSDAIELDGDSRLRVEFNRKEMLGALRRCQLTFDKDHSPLLELSLTDDKLKLYSRDNNNKESTEEVKCHLHRSGDGWPSEGVIGKFGVNLAYPLAAIASLDAETVFIQYSGPTSLVKIASEECPGMIHGMSPMVIPGEH